MRIIDGFKRFKQSRGHGVHSPFAYQLITQVFSSPHSFYAFYDIPEKLRSHGIDPRVITPFNHLSYRLVYHLKARNILEVNPGTGINTLFLMSPSTRINCTWLEKDTSGDSDQSVLSLLPRRPHRIIALPAPGGELLPFGKDLSVPGKESPVPVDDLFDAIFVNVANVEPPPIDQLLELGHKQAFWVIHPITKEPGKQYWKHIVNEKRISVTFEGKEMGTVFPWDALTPSRYFV